jgi:bacillolysin
MDDNLRKLNRIIDAGDSMSSCNGRFSLDMQTEGNFVLYQSHVGPIWWTGTQGTNANFAAMQSDGNLMVYNPSGAVWNTVTWGHPGAYLAVQNDGNLVVYGLGAVPLWASNTCCR